MSEPGRGLRDDDDHEEHPDERWLVSYSDMMTLLFGLFVMLYSLALQHKGNIDSELRKIHVGAKGDAAESNMVGVDSSSRSPTNQTESEFSAREQELERLQGEVEELTRNLQTALDENRALKESSQAREIGSVSESEPAELSESAKLLQALKTGLARKERELNEARLEIEKMKTTENSAKERVDTLEGQIAEAQETIESMKAEPKPGDFLLIVLKWTTEKHDLDLVVEDPKGHRFDFKTRVHKKVPGELMVDSRSGPGVEVYQALSPLRGEYELKIDFYNAYGNPRDAEAEISIMTPGGGRKIEGLIFNRARSKTRSFKFQLKERGEVELSSGNS